MDHLLELWGPRIKEAEEIRTNILRYLNHANYIKLQDVQRKIQRVIRFVESRITTHWFLEHQDLTKECNSALLAIVKIGKEENLF